MATRCCWPPESSEGRCLEPVLEPDLLEEVVEELSLRLRPRECQRQDDVLLRRQHRQQVEELEDEADVLSAQLRDRGVAELAEPGSRDRDVALRGLVERGEQVHQRRLSRARRPHDRRQLPGLDAERDAAERVHGGVALAVDAGELVRLDHGAVRGSGAAADISTSPIGPRYPGRGGASTCRALHRTRSRRLARRRPRFCKPREAIVSRAGGALSQAGDCASGGRERKAARLGRSAHAVRTQDAGTEPAGGAAAPRPWRGSRWASARRSQSSRRG